MRICIVAHRFPPDLGGTELYAEQVAMGLHERGHDVTVYTTETDDQRDHPFALREFTNVVPQSFGYFAWPSVFQPHIVRELRQFDVVHAVNASMFTAVVGAAVKVISPSTTTLLTTTYHDPSVQTHQTLKRTYDQTILQRVLETYDYLLVSSAFERERMAEEFDLGKCRIVRMDLPPNVDFDVDIENAAPTNADELSILFVGRLDAHKGVYDLLDAVSNLVDEGVPVRCVVVGERERWYEWPDDVSELAEQVSGVLEFRGRVSDEQLAEEYAKADVFVLPSKYETYGLVIVEALQYGTPVVATPVGIAPERITDGENGFVYDPSDSSNLTEALRRIHTLDQSELRKRSIESVSDLSWESLLDELEELYAS